MSLPENSTDSSPEQLALKAKIEELQRKIQEKNAGITRVRAASLKCHEQTAYFSTESRLAKEIEALQLELDALQTDSDSGEA